MQNEIRGEVRGAVVTSSQAAELLAGWRLHALIAYNVGLGIGLAAALILCVAFLPYQADAPSTREFPQVKTEPGRTMGERDNPAMTDAAQAEPSSPKEPAQTQTMPVTKDQAPVTSQAAQPAKATADESAQSAASIPNKVPRPTDIWFGAMLSMVVAGGLAGVLRNLHGFHVHTNQEKGLPKELEQNYYLRPLTGAILGLFTLFLGNLITSKLSEGANLGWTSLSGRMPYIGIALLAGFASQEFIGRMKAVAETLFQEGQTSRQPQTGRLPRRKDEELIRPPENEPKN